MGKTLFVLGAGFSAPLGLPVISNFLEISKNIYETDREKYSSFNAIFSRIDGMARALTHLDLDLRNIEVVLSLLDMQAYTGEDTKSYGSFQTFIRDVISTQTPALTFKRNTIGGADLNLYSQQFLPSAVFKTNKNKKHELSFISFVAMLFNLAFSCKVRDRMFHALRESSAQHRFGVISLNYDMVLENVAVELSRNFDLPDLRFSGTDCDTPFNRKDGCVSLAKIHGSIDSMTIVPPTWNKMTRRELAESWILGRRLIAQANYIIFIGYSMAPSDQYFRYLMSAGIVDSLNLKKVICVNNNDVVFSNYSSLFRPHLFKGVHTDVIEWIDDELGVFKTTQGRYSPCENLSFCK